MKMPSTCTCFRFAATFLLSVAVPSLSSGGPLLPPSSSVEATGPTGIYALPYTIDEPGSYELRNDVVLGSGNTGITIAVDNVTLNLGDHVVENNAGVGATALDFSGPRKSITVRGGVLHGWTYLIDERADGEADERVLIEDLRFEGANGIQAPESRAYTIRRCQIETLGPGIFVGDMARVIDCDVLGVSGLRSGDGIAVGDAAIVEGCRVEYGDNGILAGDHSSIRDVTVLEPSVNGVIAGSPNTSYRGNVRNAHVFKPGQNGIEAANVHDSQAYEAGGTGIRAENNVRGSEAVSAEQAGIIADGHVSYSTATSAGNEAIYGRTVSFTSGTNLANGTAIGASTVVAYSLGKSEGIGAGIELYGENDSLFSNFGGQVVYSTGINTGTIPDGSELIPDPSISAAIVVGSSGSSVESDGINGSSSVSNSQGFSQNRDGIDAGIISFSSGRVFQPGSAWYGLRGILGSSSLPIQGSSDFDNTYDMP